MSEVRKASFGKLFGEVCLLFEIWIRKRPDNAWNPSLRRHCYLVSNEDVLNLKSEMCLSLGLGVINVLTEVRPRVLEAVTETPRTDRERARQ